MAGGPDIDDGWDDVLGEDVSAPIRAARAPKTAETPGAASSSGSGLRRTQSVVRSTTSDTQPFVSRPIVGPPKRAAEPAAPAKVGRPPTLKGAAVPLPTTPQRTTPMATPRPPTPRKEAGAPTPAAPQHTRRLVVPPPAGAESAASDSASAPVGWELASEPGVPQAIDVEPGTAEGAALADSEPVRFEAISPADSQDVSLEPIPLRDSEVIAIPAAATPRPAATESGPGFGSLSASATSGPRSGVHVTEKVAPADRRGPLPLMLGAAAVLVVGAGIWVATREDVEPTPTPAVTVRPTTPARADRGGAAPQREAPEPPVVPSRPVEAAPSQAPEAQAAPQAPPEEEAESEAAPHAEAVPPAELAEPPVLPGATDAAARYESARAEYARTTTQESLEIMALEACAMEHGPKARSAFRKLRGTDVRKSVMIACRKSNVDLTVRGDDFTGAERIRQAERALEAGQHELALTLAREANRLEQTSAAVLIMALAQCHSGDLAGALAKRRHLGRDDRKTLTARCPGLTED